jgi:hypothetical protein
VVCVADPYGRILGFLDRSATFLSSSSSVVLTSLSGPRSRLTTFFLVVLGIEPGPPDLWRKTLTTRPQRRSYIYIYTYLFFGVEWSTITEATDWPIVPAQNNDECGANGAMLGRGNR